MTIRAENVCQSYGRQPVLDNLSLELDTGSFFTLLGPMGCGKTTLLRILAGIEKPVSGRIFYDGVDVTKLPVQERKIAFVYQQFINYPSLSVFENIASPLRVAKEKRSEGEIKRKVLEVSELLGLSHVLHHLPEEVSGGQRQRCAIARALVKEARFIFLDEPLANLDYKLREELRTELKQIFKDRGGVVVYATPEPIDALMMATHVGFLHEGAILQQGEVQEVYRNPSHASVASYFCHPQMNLLPCEVESRVNGCRLRISSELEIDVAIGKDRLPADHYLLGIRPHHLSLADPKNRMTSFTAKVELAEVVGSNTELHLRHGETKLTLLMQQVEQFPVGEAVTAYMDPDHLCLFNKETGAFVTRTNKRVD